jgi:glycosyltransferase involved in cell wall biosynthesis
VIPFYNEYLYLENAVYSILTQTHKNLEVLIVDDSGKHGAKSIVAEIQDQRVKLLDYGDNRGVSAARNFGLDRAKGDWVYFLDSDDFVSSRWIEKCLSAGLESGLPVCGVTGQKREGGSTLACFGGHNDDFAIFAMKADGGLIAVATHHQYMYSRKFLNDHKILFTEGLLFGEDLVFYLEVAYYSRLCALATGGAAYYFRSPESPEKPRLYNSWDHKKWANTLAQFKKAVARLRLLYGPENLERKAIDDLIYNIDMKITRLARSRWQKFARQLLACFIPNKKLRQRVRG